MRILLINAELTKTFGTIIAFLVKYELQEIFIANTILKPEPCAV